MAMGTGLGDSDVAVNGDGDNEARTYQIAIIAYSFVVPQSVLEILVDHKLHRPVRDAKHARNKTLQTQRAKVTQRPDTNSSLLLIGPEILPTSCHFYFHFHLLSCLFRNTDLHVTLPVFQVMLSVTPPVQKHRVKPKKQMLCDPSLTEEVFGYYPIGFTVLLHHVFFHRISIHFNLKKLSAATQE